MSSQLHTTFISTEKVVEKLSDPHYKILDLRNINKYNSGHIPGSIHIDSEIFNQLNEEGYNVIPNFNLVQYTLQSAGINKGDKIILVDDVFNLNCALPTWTFHYYGFFDVYLIDGALQKWQKENLPLTAEPFEPNDVGDIELEDRESTIFISKDEIVVNLQTGDFLFVDNRSEFALTMDQHGGAIPNAVHFWWMDLYLENPDYFVLKHPFTVLNNLQSLGIEKEKTIIVYCESAPQSALVYLVMKDLGYKDVRLYLAGYAEWRIICGFM